VNVWLTTRLGAEFTEYTQNIGQMFLIAMVARIMEPGCQADYMLILDGPQGVEKSKACRILAGDTAFSENLPLLDQDPVRVSMALRGMWLVEISEMHTFRRANIESLKAFVTRRVEQFTPKYARSVVSEPRQCLFIGTANGWQHEDVTGARRFWPVLVGQLHLDRLTGMRDQLLAEALTLFRQGEPHWPDAAFENQHIKPTQEERLRVDARLNEIETYLVGRTNTTLLELWQHCLHGEMSRYGRPEQLMVAGCLRVLGWKETHRHGKSRFWGKA